MIMVFFASSSSSHGTIISMSLKSACPTSMMRRTRSAVDITTSVEGTVM